MSEYLYVCHFSNGHIKVGRSDTPQDRIETHVNRVSCVGIELKDAHVVQCVGDSIVAESELINVCTTNATGRHKKEWFYGLNFSDVCTWANDAASKPVVDEDAIHWPTVIKSIKARYGYTQLQISEKCNCSLGAIGNLEAGIRKDPCYSIGSKIVNLYLTAPQIS